MVSAGSHRAGKRCPARRWLVIKTEAAGRSDVHTDRQFLVREVNSAEQIQSEPKSGTQHRNVPIVVDPFSGSAGLSVAARLEHRAGAV
jgi:hypothetical protein